MFFKVKRTVFFRKLFTFGNGNVVIIRFGRSHIEEIRSSSGS